MTAIQPLFIRTPWDAGREWMEYVGGAAYKVLVHADPPRSNDMEEDVR